MSCQTAPVSLVTTAMTAGRSGSGRLRAASNRPSALSRALSASNWRVRSPNPAGWTAADVELVDAIRVEHVDPAVGDDPQPGPRLVRRGQPVVPEPDALELAALVLEREVRVARARHGDPPDLALDPHVVQPLVAPDGLADGPGDARRRRGSSARTSRPARPARRARPRVLARRGLVGRVPGRQRPVRRLALGHPKPSWMWRQRSSLPRMLRR